MPTTLTLTIAQVYDATLTLTAIINRKAPMPAKGKYRCQRLHSKLLPEWTIINAHRDEMIAEYNYFGPEVKDPEGNVISAPSTQASVPPDKAEEFRAAWEKYAKDTIEVVAEPIPLSQLDLGDSTNGSIEAHEFASLGDLIAE